MIGTLIHYATYALPVVGFFVLVFLLRSIVRVLSGGAVASDMEHGLYCYFGRLGQGKTYAMVRDLIRALDGGAIVYASFQLNWSGYDERRNVFKIFLAAVGLKREFLEYPASNARFLPVSEKWHEEFGALKGSREHPIIVAVDEAPVLFDSYQMAKMPLYQRININQTRKFFRSVWYTAQRPSAVHVVMRAMTNVFYRCEKWNILGGTFFARDEFDLGADDAPDFENRLSRKLYLASKRFFDAYNTYETIGIAQPLVQGSTANFEGYKLHTVRPRDVFAALAARRPRR